MAFIQPLDLYNIVLNNFAGSAVIFAGIAILIIAMLAARFRMNGALVLIMTFFFIIMFSTTLGMPITFLAILIFGLVVFYLLSKPWKQ